MKERSLTTAFALTVVTIILATTCWEIYLRHTGVPLAYDEGKELWADKRAHVYDNPEKTTVFIGSSRIKFDLDIDTWQKITGREAVQLAEQGTSPMPILEDLGNDPKFHGKLVVDVTESLFFSDNPAVTRETTGFVAYYKHRTPAQKVSIALDKVLESKLLFLDQSTFSLNAELDKWKLPNRAGLFVMPDFPMDFSRTTVDRQNKMTDRFVSDTILQQQVQHIWLFLMNAGHGHGPKTDPVPHVLQSAAAAVKKIRSRGGEVVFLRTPDRAPIPGGEATVFPRKALWDPLLQITQSTGFYFSDNPATAHFRCPEWSHLTPADAVLYTRALAAELPSSFVK